MNSAARYGILLTLLPIVASCSVGGSIPGARGLSPVLNYADVQASTGNYTQVRDAFIIRAGYAPNGAVDWYEVTRAGFDYVDEQCGAYLNALYDARRVRDATNRQLQSLDGATSAILGFANAGSQAILITAAAFGLATQSVDNASSALLFAMDPTDIQSLLRNQTQAYRMGVASQAASYRTSNAAMEAIRGYLSLCLPVSIEGQVRAALQGTEYIANPTNYGVPSLSRVQTASSGITGLAPSRQDIISKPIVVPAAPTADSLAKGLLPGDVVITSAELKILQGKLCVEADGDIGGAGSKTRIAIQWVQAIELFEQTGKLDEKTKPKIESLANCDRATFRNVYEQVRLATAQERIDLKADLKAYVETSKVLSAEIKALVAKPDFIVSDGLDADTRAVISAIQAATPGMVVDGSLTPAIHNII